MKENRNQIEIKATPKEVWEVLTNLEKYAEWNPLMYHAKGNIEEGGSVDLSVRTTSTEMRFDCTVTSVEPNHELAWKFHVIHPFLFRGEHIFRIERINDETVKFIDRENFKGPLVLLRGKYLDTEVKEGMIVMDEALKQKVEQQRRR